METVYFFSYNNEKADKIKKLCQMLGLGFEKIGGDELLLTVENVINNHSPLGLKMLLNAKNGKNSASKKASLPPMYYQPEIMLFSELAESSLDKFLDAYKKSGIEPVGLRAVVTPFNKTKNLVELTKMLQAEKASFDNK